MPFCHQCGAENPASARFCDQCGAALIPVPANAPPAATAPATPPPVSAASQTVPAGAITSAGPSTCPQCGMSVIPGEAFCDHCGASLLTSAPPTAVGSIPPAPPFSGVPPQPSYPPPQPVGSPPATPDAAPVAAFPIPPAPPRPTQPAPAPAAPARPVQPAPAPAPARTTLTGLQLVVQSSGAVLLLPGVTQALVGRADPVSNYYPEVDLSPHGALENGVGRRHMRLLVQNGQVYAEDLDSTNGTFINGQKLSAKTPQPVRSGDELRLGRLVLRLQG